MALTAGQSWAPAIVLFGLAFLVYPDGGALTSRWRWVIRAYGVLGCAWICGTWALVVLAAARHDIQIDAGGNLTTGQNALWFSALSEVFFLGTGVAWLAWLGYQVVAWRRSAGEYRQQLKWLIGGAAVCAACGIALVAWGTMPSAVAAIAACGVAALPVSLGIGILKFRLYDIDRIISRTLAYTIVTGLLVGLYAGLVLLATKVLAVSSPVAVRRGDAGRGGAVQRAAAPGAAGGGPPVQPRPLRRRGHRGAVRRPAQGHRRRRLRHRRPRRRRAAGPAAGEPVRLDAGVRQPPGQSAL